MDNLAFINRVLELTNQERSRLGLSPLTLSPLLSQAAQTHSQNMALQDFFSHTGLDGSSPSDRARIVGYSSGTAENIAAGYTTPEAVVTGWMNSPGHRENILNPNYRTIGVGYHFLANDTGQVNWNHYWTQMFGFAADPMPMVSLQSMNAIQYGTEESDRLFGTPGNDTLFALGGDDTVQGDSVTIILMECKGAIAFLGKPETTPFAAEKATIPFSAMMAMIGCTEI
uniref:CAP domain-containing protein n=1 Tax=Desertifilum tharense IPPAS B-1220 TaxID=1781255 RepID=A0ACD5GYD8_9CYAN